MADLRDPENWGSDEESESFNLDEGGQTEGESSTDPGQTLEQLKAQRTQVQAEIDKDAKLLAALEEDIKAFTDVTGLIEQILKAYSDALPDLTKRQKEAKGYSETKMRMILCAIEDCKDAIDEKIARYDHSIKRREHRLQHLERKKAEAGQHSQEAQARLQIQQEQFAYWTEYQANLDKNLKETGELKTQIEQEDSESHTASMYFLARELIAVLDHARIVSPEQLAEKLNQAWNDLNAAKTDARNKKYDWDAAIAEYQAAKTDLDEARKNRRQKLLEAVSEFNPQKKTQSGGQY